MPKIETISLKSLKRAQERVIRKGRTVHTRRRPRSTIQSDFYELGRSVRLKRFREYYGELVYKKRDNWWFIIFIGLNEEVGSFSSRGAAEGWAELFLGRKY